MTATELQDTNKLLRKIKVSSAIKHTRHVVESKKLVMTDNERALLNAAIETLRQIRERV